MIAACGPLHYSEVDYALNGDAEFDVETATYLLEEPSRFYYTW